MNGVVLFTQGGDTSPHEIVSAWERLKKGLHWMPEWFRPENIQDIMEYLLDRLPAEQLLNIIALRMSMGVAVRFEVAIASSGEKRVFIAPAGSNGIPDARGCANFYWADNGGARRMYMDVQSCSPPV